MRTEKAIKLLEETGLDCMYEEETQEALWMAIDALKEKEKLIHCKDLPSAEQEQKTGKWIEHGVKEGHLIEKFTCSECDYYSGTKTSNYCPNCGADMRELK